MNFPTLLIIVALTCELEFADTTSTSGIYATVAMIFLFQGSYSFGLTNLTVLYPPEVLNYSIRATGMACFTVGANMVG